MVFTSKTPGVKPPPLFRIALADRRTARGRQSRAQAAVFTCVHMCLPLLTDFSRPSMLSMLILLRVTTDHALPTVEAITPGAHHARDALTACPSLSAWIAV